MLSTPRTQIAQPQDTAREQKERPTSARKDAKDDHKQSLDIQSRFINALRTQSSYRRSDRPAVLPDQRSLSPDMTDLSLDPPRRRAQASPDVRKPCRKGLPINFHSAKGKQEVITKYDSGTHDNHMSLDQAKALGYQVDISPPSVCEFALPNGEVIKSIGRVSAQVDFARGPSHETGAITCFFNVFAKLSTPVLIGLTFLEATDTLKKFSQRLVDLPRGPRKCWNLRAVGQATNQVSCIVNGKPVTANADTGCELPLMSGTQAAKYGLLEGYECEELELVDGSLMYTSGYAEVTFRIPGSDYWFPPNSKTGGRWEPRTKTVRFSILKNLQFDMILDEDMVDEFKVFHKGLCTVTTAAANAIASLAPIVHLGSKEQTVSRTTEKVKDWFSSMFSSKKEPETPIPIAENPPLVEIDAHPELTKLMNAVSELDQHENRRIDRYKVRKNYTMAEARQFEVMQRRYNQEKLELVQKIDDMFKKKGSDQNNPSSTGMADPLPGLLLNASTAAPMLPISSSASSSASASTFTPPSPGSSPTALPSIAAQTR